MRHYLTFGIRDKFSTAISFQKISDIEVIIHIYNKNKNRQFEPSDGNYPFFYKENYVMVENCSVFDLDKARAYYRYLKANGYTETHSSDIIFQNDSQDQPQEASAA